MSRIISPSDKLQLLFKRGARRFSTGPYWAGLQAGLAGIRGGIRGIFFHRRQAKAKDINRPDFFPPQAVQGFSIRRLEFEA